MIFQALVNAAGYMFTWFINLLPTFPVLNDFTQGVGNFIAIIRSFNSLIPVNTLITVALAVIGFRSWAWMWYGSKWLVTRITDIIKV